MSEPIAEISNGIESITYSTDGPPMWVRCESTGGPNAWITYEPYSQLKNVSSLNDFVITTTERNDKYFDFCRSLHEQRELLNVWLEEYVFLRDEAYDIFSRNPNEYNAIRLRQISNYLDGFLEANRILEIILSDLQSIKDFAPCIVQGVKKYMSASEAIARAIDIQILNETLRYLDPEREQHCYPVYDRRLPFEVMTQYELSGTFGTYDTETIARVSIG